ncbi:MAG: hypothetical protein ABSA96_08605 [Candidatus Acidiferrales bacterium]|jgi:hypothetical protein
MSTEMKRRVFPIALLMTGILTIAQSQTLAAQGSRSSANATTSANPDPTTGQRGQLVAGELSSPESKEEAIYGDARPDGSAKGVMLAVNETAGVNKSMDELSRAFSNKDLGAIRQVWPSISEGPLASLGKSFSYFKSASRNFKPEKIDVNGDTAKVIGGYSGSFVNGTTTIPSSGRFHATLTKIGTRWIVVTLVCD